MKPLRFDYNKLYLYTTMLLASRMEPIAKRLKQSAESFLQSNGNSAKEKDIAERIERLEAELQGKDNDISDSCSDSESDFSNDKAEAVLNLSAYASERIGALPANMLPAAGVSSDFSLARKKRKKMQQEKNEFAANKALGHLSDALTFPKKVPFACKPCNFIGKDLNEFQAHKTSKEHMLRLQCDDRKLQCDLCHKTFTSVAQVNEHRAGKWHKQRAQQKKKRHVVKVCYDFMRGKCNWGDRCNFEHTETKAMRCGRALDKTRRRICDSFARTKSCRFGENCLFSHHTI